MALLQGLPEEIVLDNWPEGTDRAIFDWLERTGVRLCFIEPGRPVQSVSIMSGMGTILRTRLVLDVLNMAVGRRRRSDFCDPQSL